MKRLLILLLFTIPCYGQTCGTVAAMKANGKSLIASLDVYASQLRHAEDAAERSPHTDNPTRDAQIRNANAAKRQNLKAVIGTGPKTKKLFADANAFYACVLKSSHQPALTTPAFKAGMDGRDMVINIRNLEELVKKLR